MHRRGNLLIVKPETVIAWHRQGIRLFWTWKSRRRLGRPGFLIRDRDRAFGGWTDTANAMGIDTVLTALHSPWQNAYCERFIGSVRRECLDHVIVFNATGLQRLMDRYRDY